MSPKKKLKPLEGQIQPSFAKWPEVSQHQEQEAVTAIEKDDVTANEESVYAHYKEETFSSHDSKLIHGWSMRKVEIVCIVKSARRLRNRAELARKPSLGIFKTPR